MDLNELKQSTEKGKRKIVKQLINEALEEGLDLNDILQALLDAMDTIGEKFKNNEIFVPEMLIAARAMKTGMEILEPQLIDAGITPDNKAIVGTVAGDLHDIGKNLVVMMLKGANFDVVDLGVDVSPEDFLAAVEEHKPQLVALSALLTTTMPAMRDTIKLIREAGHTDLKIMIGGAPITQEYADEIGADGYAGDAATAVENAKSIL